MKTTTNNITDPIPVPPKKWYKSKTIWVAIIGLIGMPIVYMYMIKDPIALDTLIQAFGSGLAMVIMRFVTNKPVDNPFIEQVIQDVVEDMLDRHNEEKED